VKANEPLEEFFEIALQEEGEVTPNLKPVKKINMQRDARPGQIAKIDGKDHIFIGGQWKLHDPELRNGDPTPKVKDEQSPTLAELQRAFHERVIRIGSNNRQTRMVGYASGLQEYDKDYPPEPRIDRVWFPSVNYEENEGRKFNLVFSLASDGRHYLVADRDQPSRPMGTSNILLPSTSNWHEYGRYPMSWERVLEANINNPGYHKQIAKSGLAGLRPPWIFKNDDGELKSMQAYRDIEPWTYPDKPAPEREVLAWEELGWDDD
jgi:hypothetical protein